MNKFWNFKNVSDSVGELMLYGDISSQSWWGDEVTPKNFKEDLDALGDVGELNIYINSGGGDVFAGQAIYSMLKRHKAHKTAFIDGIAASVASVIAMAADKIRIPRNANIMIHNSWTFATGNKGHLRKVADDMEKIDASIISVYAERTGLGENEIIMLMDAETWFTAEEAVKKGFADEIEETKQIAASINGDIFVCNGLNFNLEKYKNKPNIKNTIEQEQPPNEGGFLMPNNGGDSQPVEDIALNKQKDIFNNIKKKIIGG